MKPSFCVMLCRVLLLSFLVVRIAASDDTSGSAYKPELGRFQVQSIKRVVVEDTNRKKELQLRINYPAENGLFPVIVWSHGAGGSKDNYLPLTEYWTSHGYVTIQPTHSDSRSLAVKASDPVSFGDWQSRPADISFILDSLPELEKKEPALQGHLDAKRIGVGGHSFGANTAQLVGGAKAFLVSGEKSFADQRVTTVMMLSGQGPGEMLRESSWENFVKPLLVMTGSADGPTRTGQPAEWRKKPYELSPSGNKYLVWVEGLDHGYGGITGWNFNPKNKPNADHVRYTKMVTLAYWDTYLKASPEARVYLESDKLPTLSRGAVHLDRK